MEDGISSCEDLISNPSFRKWAKGTLDKREAEWWDDWCRRSETNRKLAMKAQSELLGITPVLSDHSNDDREWENISKKLQKIRLNNQSNNGPLRWGIRAAVGLLVIAITGLLTYHWDQSQKELVTNEKAISWKKVSTTYAEQKNITLSDGSNIILSANSSIQYIDGWVQNSEIKIKLDGEAYFSIPHKKTSDRPLFQVQTSDGSVFVTGTKFVVDTDEVRTRVVLERGSIMIERRLSGNDTEKEIMEMKSRQLVEFNREVMTLKEVNPDVYTSWTRHKLVLDNSPFSYLAEKIRKTYGVKVKVNDDKLYNKSLTGTINFRSLDRLLSAISTVLEIEVTQKDNEVIFASNFN